MQSSYLVKESVKIWQEPVSGPHCHPGGLLGLETPSPRVLVPVVVDVVGPGVGVEGPGLEPPGAKLLCGLLKQRRVLVTANVCGIITQPRDDSSCCIPYFLLTHSYVRNAKPVELEDADD